VTNSVLYNNGNEHCQQCCVVHGIKSCVLAAVDHSKSADNSSCGTIPHMIWPYLYHINCRWNPWSYPTVFVANSVNCKLF